MEKKKYQAPKMEILKYSHDTYLLSGSGDEPVVEPDGYDDEFSLNFGGNNNRHA